MRGFTNFLTTIIKVLVIVALIGIGILVYQACAGGHIIQRIDNTPPDITVAQYQVVTETHLYYAKEATLTLDGSATIKGWYEKVNSKWVFHKDTVLLPAVLHPGISRR